MEATEQRLDRLIAAIDGRLDGQPVPELRITSLADDSEAVRPGSLFVAAPGTHQDGHRFVTDAIEAGAAAIVAEHEVPDATVPVIRVESSRRALARLAAEWWGRPAERLSLVGVTGTVGKTTVVTMLEAILTEAGMQPGVVGSLGAGIGDAKRNTGMTTPDPMVLHEVLADIADERELALMEVTSHALVQERVHGLEFDLGILTNLVMLEHQDYHGSFRRYVESKLRFFEHLPTGTPVVHPAGDRVVAQAVAERDVTSVACGAGVEGVALHIERTAMTSRGTRLLFQVEEPLPRLDGSSVPPTTFPVALQLLGRAAINNASLAAGAALVLGIEPQTVAEALPKMQPPRRRMELTRVGELCVLDDTVGHPDSVTGVFEVAEVVPHDRLFIVYAIRGQRGPEINRRDAEALGIWHGRVPIAHLAVTSSADQVDDLNRVTDEERAAFMHGLHSADPPRAYHDDLTSAVADVAERAGPDDLVLLLGAQGMDRGREILSSES